MANLSKGNERSSRKREEAGGWRRECRVLEQQALREGRNDTKRKCKLPLFFFTFLPPDRSHLTLVFFLLEQVAHRYAVLFTSSITLTENEEETMIFSK